MTDTENRSNNAAEIRQLCLEQAQGFIDAAELLVATDKFPNIVYHLSLLALEEVGKGSIVGARAVSNNNSPWVEKALESHTRKLQWALWSPMKRINPRDFADAGVIAKDLHERRLSSLYVDPNSDPTEISLKKEDQPRTGKGIVECGTFAFEIGGGT